MRLLESNYLRDGKLFNRGQRATLIEVEREADYDALLGNIVRTRYYDEAYFRAHSGMQERRKVAHFWAMSELVRAIQPRRVLDIGCGRGDLISFLKDHNVSVSGIDFSEDLRRLVWPNVRDSFVVGDFRDVSKRMASEGTRFDTICAFDIWEHLLPSELPRSIESIAGLVPEDGLLLFMIPAFGEDRVFGQQFPLEFDENRAAFESRTPFRYLLAESIDPPIPASGHLIWAHTEWWEAQFVQRGFVRLTEVEKRLHRLFDWFFPFSARSFYLFARNEVAVAARVSALLKMPTIARQPLTFARLGRDVARGRLRSEVLGIVRQLVENTGPAPVRKLAETLRQRARKFF